MNVIVAARWDCYVPAMLTHPLANYLSDCRARHSTGAVTPETTYYAPFETLVNAVGLKLKKPRVRCFMNLKNVDGNMDELEA